MQEDGTHSLGMTNLKIHFYEKLKVKEEQDANTLNQLQTFL